MRNICDTENLLDVSDEELHRALDEMDEPGEDKKKETGKGKEPDPEAEEKRKKQSQRIKKNGYLMNWVDDNNPYRDQSNVDLDEEMEKGWRRIETSVLLELMKAKLSGTEWSIFFYILHRTRGWSNKKTKLHPEERLKVCEIVKSTGMTRRSIYRGLESLKEKRLIYRIVDEYGNEKWGNNFRYDTWIY